MTGQTLTHLSNLHDQGAGSTQGGGRGTEGGAVE